MKTLLTILWHVKLMFFFGLSHSKSEWIGCICRVWEQELWEACNLYWSSPQQSSSGSAEVLLGQNIQEAEIDCTKKDKKSLKMRQVLQPLKFSHSKENKKIDSTECHVVDSFVVVAWFVSQCIFFFFKYFLKNCWMF